MAAPRKRLGEALIGKGLITEAQLQDALREQGLTKEFLGAILLKRKLITERDLLENLFVSEGGMMEALRRHREWVAANIQRLLRKDYHGDGKEDRSNSP